jgi:hypothetical protein
LKGRKKRAPEKLDIRLYISTQIKYFTDRQNPGCFQHDLLSVMIGGFEVTSQANFIDKLTALRFERGK